MIKKTKIYIFLVFSDIIILGEVKVMNKKRKLKIKWKNILIIILLITIISFTIIKTISYIKENPKEEKTEQQIKYEKKLKKLDNIDEKIKYFTNL